MKQYCNDGTYKYYISLILKVCEKVINRQNQEIM